jgi:Tol biopolymer transport system component
VYVTNAMGDWSLVRAAKVAPGAAVSVVVRGEDAPSLGSVAAARDTKLIAFHTQIRDVWTIGTVHPDGSEFMLLTEGMNPKLSPDGTRIAFERQVGSYWQVFTVDADSGSDLTQVTNGNANAGSVEWSPDGKWLVFSSSAGANRFASSDGSTYNLFTIRPDGSGLTQLTDGPAKTTEPCWGSDGYIYFASNEGGTFDLWRIKPALDAG